MLSSLSCTKAKMLHSAPCLRDLTWQVNQTRKYSYRLR